MEMNSDITGKLCLPQEQLQLKCNLWCRKTEWQVFCILATFCSDYSIVRIIHHKGKVLHLLRDEVLTLACIFFKKFSISSRK